ncbi:hypothetical protein ACO2Q1_00290 [Brevundimonas sp. VNH65]|uniref:hypothetical protein n=1 Tax=Brevundimonas sp. VNH65 TaxID=3400917 RepID=UPI003C032113
MPKPPTVDDLEDFWDMLQGPTGGLLLQVGAIVGRRLDERRQALADLTDTQMLDLLHPAFLEAAPKAYPQSDAETVANANNAMFALAAMSISANADSTDAIN